MKKLVLIGMLSTFSFNSFAQFSLTCPEIYERIMISKEIKKNKVGNLGEELSVGGFLMGLGAPAVGLTILAGSVGASVYANTKSREERVMELKEEGSRELKKLTRKLQKKISSDITSEEIMEIVQGGLTDGLYCQNFPEIANKKFVERHVQMILREKYSSRQ